MINVQIGVLHGPNLFTPYAAVVAEFISPFSEKMTVAQIESLWRLIDDSNLWDQSSHSNALTFSEIAAQIAYRIQYPNHNHSDKKNIRIINEARKSLIFIDFIDHEISTNILRASIRFTEYLFLAANGHDAPLKSSANKLSQLKQTLMRSLPHSPIIRTLVEEAKRRSIPVYPVAKNSGIWLIGQGVAGVHYYEAANHNDSFTGMQLQRDKILSNLLVKRMGFPGVRHSLARDLKEANEIAERIGYPVVVKPSSSGKGNGISAFVIDSNDLTQAFNKASHFSSGAVIIEAHVKGNDHRLAVFGGKLAWVAARYPAKVLGDGQSSIRKLIEQENQLRQHDSQAHQNGLKQINPNEDVIKHLFKQGLTLESKPLKNETVTLLDIANISKGGSISDLTDLAHPDNVVMAEAISRGFRMDTMGIDFITPDIRVSWRDTPCAVIEVNGTPGIFFDERAAKILDAKFPGGHQGRVPSIMLVSLPENFNKDICEILIEHNKCVGFTNSSTSHLNGQPRCQQHDHIHKRVNALISDPSCDAIVIAVKAEDLIKNGLPLDWVDLTLVVKPIPQDLATLLNQHSGQYIDQPVSIKKLSSTIKKILQNMHTAMQQS
jgi:cyanophycin synthetase